MASGAGQRAHPSLLARVSIIVPVGPGEDAWRSLVQDCAEAELAAELLLIASSPEPDGLGALMRHGNELLVARWVATTAGRAHQMNLGAQIATKHYLWFLHADSKVGVDALLALEQSLDSHPHALHFFDLAFQNDGPRLVRWNDLGARIRSRYLALPFGDQGLCMSRDVFQRLGGFDETAAYGEDHLLVWAAHRHRVPLRPVKAAIATSARKYRKSGWLKTTLLHGWRTWSQAIPQAIKLIRSRIR